MDIVGTSNEVGVVVGEAVGVVMIVIVGVVGEEAVGVVIIAIVGLVGEEAVGVVIIVIVGVVGKEAVGVVGSCWLTLGSDSSITNVGGDPLEESERPLGDGIAVG